MTTRPFRGKTSAASVLGRVLGDSTAAISAMIEIADRCNEVCVHCYQIQGQKGEMTTAQVKRVLDELADMGVLFLTISGGEPTLRHDFLEIVAHARALKFSVKLFTNGLTMTESLAKRLAELALQEVQISLYSVDAEKHDWVTKVPGSWEKTVAGVKHLASAGVPVVLKTPVMSFNVDEVAQYRDFAASLGVDYSLDTGEMSPREDGSREPQAFDLTPEQRNAVRDDASMSSLRKEPLPPTRLETNVCGACAGAVHIEANGELRPCTQLNVGCGNVLVDGVRGAWEQNENSQSLRALTWEKLHGCRDCDLRGYCERCYAHVAVSGGDPLGPYHEACSRALAGFERIHGSYTMRPAADGARDARLGPYRIVAEATLEPIADEVRPDDLALREGIGAVIRGTPSPAALPARPGDLIQIRRPGRASPAVERVPGTAHKA